MNVSQDSNISKIKFNKHEHQTPNCEPSGWHTGQSCELENNGLTYWYVILFNVTYFQKLNQEI